MSRRTEAKEVRFITKPCSATAGDYTGCYIDISDVVLVFASAKNTGKPWQAVSIGIQTGSNIVDRAIQVGTQAVIWEGRMPMKSPKQTRVVTTFFNCAAGNVLSLVIGYEHM